MNKISIQITMELQMAKCDMCGAIITHLEQLQCCTESGKSVNHLTNYTTNNNQYILKPNHSKFFSECCSLHDNNQIKFTLKHIFKLKENFKQENSELHKIIHEQRMIISNIEEKIQKLETSMLTEKLNETTFDNRNLNELFKLINNTNETIKKDNVLIHQIINEDQVEKKNQKINEKIYKVATFIQLGNLMNCLLLYLIYYY